MKIWIAGSDGGIGSACVDAMRKHPGNIVWAMDGSYDVGDGENIVKFLGPNEPEALVYAVGTSYLEWSDKVLWSEVLRVFDVNVVGLLRCLQLATTVKKCVVIGSDAATRPMRTSVAYNASKAALHAAVKVIARERAETLQINVVAPGLIAPTGMTDYVYDRTKELRPGFSLQEYMTDQIPAGRSGQPSEVAQVVKWLLESAPDYLNGAIIDVNGAR